MDDKHVRTLEELSLNNWQPLSTLLYDGWILRFAEGYTKRANSVNPIHQSTLELQHKIEACERMYAENRLSTIFKITPLAQPSHLDRILEEKGYALVEPTSVRTLSLNRLPEPRMDSVRIEKSQIPAGLRTSAESIKSRICPDALWNVCCRISVPKRDISRFLARIGLLPADSA